MKIEAILCRYFAHGYFFGSILGLVLLFPAYDIAVWLLNFGASSTYIAFGIFLTASVSKFWGICAFIWSVLFPILLISAYILALRQQCRMLLVSVILDVLVVALFLVHTILTQNWYGMQYAITDLIVSLCVLLFFVIVLHRNETE